MREEMLRLIEIQLREYDGIDDELYDTWKNIWYIVFNSFEKDYQNEV